MIVTTLTIEERKIFSASSYQESCNLRL